MNATPAPSCSTPASVAAGMTLSPHTPFARDNSVSTEETEHSPASPHILIADDDADIRLVSARMLTNAGFAVDVVKDGEEAWDALACNRYDLLLTDHYMPRLTGLELIGRLRSRAAHIPIVLMSGGLFSLRMPPDAQPDSTLQKPFSVTMLIDTVTRHLSASSF